MFKLPSNDNITFQMRIGNILILEIIFEINTIIKEG